MVKWSSDWDPNSDQPLQASLCLRVLVVGNKRVAATLCDELCTAGLEGFTAHSGLSGLLTAEKRRPEVVLIDLALPNMDGIDLANSIRSTECLQETVLIALSSHAEESAYWESRGLAIDRYLVKPINLPQLAGLIHSTWSLTRNGPSGKPTFGPRDRFIG
jgi:DNA-binding response OmpR family regulator